MDNCRSSDCSTTGTHLPALTQRVHSWRAWWSICRGRSKVLSSNYVMYVEDMFRASVSCTRCSLRAWQLIRSSSRERRFCFRRLTPSTQDTKPRKRHSVRSNRMRCNRQNAAQSRISTVSEKCGRTEIPPKGSDPEILHCLGFFLRSSPQTRLVSYHSCFRVSIRIERGLVEEKRV